MATNAEHQRRWRERRNALANEALRNRALAERKPRSRKVAGTTTEQTNALIGELLEFWAAYNNKTRAWLEHAKLSDEDRATLADRIHQAANGLTLLAQRVSGDDLA